MRHSMVFLADGPFPLFKAFLLRPLLLHGRQLSSSSVDEPVAKLAHGKASLLQKQRLFVLGGVWVRNMVVEPFSQDAGDGFGQVSSPSLVSCGLLLFRWVVPLGFHLRLHHIVLPVSIVQAMGWGQLHRLLAMHLGRDTGLNRLLKLGLVGLVALLLLGVHVCVHVATQSVLVVVVHVGSPPLLTVPAM